MYSRVLISEGRKRGVISYRWRNHDYHCNVHDEDYEVAKIFRHLKYVHKMSIPKIEE